MYNILKIHNDNDIINDIDNGISKKESIKLNDITKELQ